MKASIKTVATLKTMATLRITEEDLARGAEIVIEEGSQPAAGILAPIPKVRLLPECIAIAEKRGFGATLDDARFSRRESYCSLADVVAP